MEFFVPLLPPSVNHYKLSNGRGGFYLSKDAQAFFEAVCIISHREKCPGELYHLDLSFSIHKPEYLRWDMDNFLKVTWDALTRAGIIKDDRYIVSCCFRKFSVAERQDVGVQYSIEGA